jgi:DNA adenine methylase
MNIDPPYFVRGQELYLNFYEPKDHEKLAKIIRSLKCNWILTYDDAKEVQDLYSGLPVFRKGLTYYAQVKRRASELLVLSPSLNTPDGMAAELEAA